MRIGARSGTRRGLLTASVEAGLRVRTRLLAKEEWLPILREIVQPGDQIVIVCHVQQSSRWWKDPRRTLAGGRFLP
jgi:hypothetical protein